jgi:quinol monooxygenase YgiN
MPIYTIAEYRVKASGADKVKAAIEEFVPYVRDNEPGTRLYEAWQHEEDQSRFVHFFIFEDEAAHDAHSKSAAVKRFEAAYRPELIGGDVNFRTIAASPQTSKTARARSCAHITMRQSSATLTHADAFSPMVFCFADCSARIALRMTTSPTSNSSCK